MPGFDRTGPMGQGPMTGGRRGRCVPGSTAYPSGQWWPGAGYGGGRGFGRGRGAWCYPGRGGGFGRGYRRFWGTNLPVAAPDPAAEIDMLKSEADYLKQSLEAINRRIGDLESGEKEVEQ